MARSEARSNTSKNGRESPALQDPPGLLKTAGPQRKRNRSQEAEHPSLQTRDQPNRKRLRNLPSSCAGEDTLSQETTSDIKYNSNHPTKYWIRTRRWPKDYFEQDSQVREDFEHDSWLEEQVEESNQVVQYVELNGTRYPRPLKKVPTSLRRKQSDSSLTGSSDQKKRESKSAPYRNKRYTTLLAAKGSYMEKSDSGVTDTSLTWCAKLLNSEQTVPKDSLFRDDMFETTCRKVQDRNEARVIRSITPYIVPSVEDLATLGAAELRCLIENVNEGWTGGIPVRSAFTDEQLDKLDPLIGTVYDTSFFVATYQMYFPFFTCEVKCGAAALDIADRQNAHSMTLAVRGIVELYKAVKREKELHREIIAFSVSHDHNSVRIYGHYAIIEGDKTTFYRHPIRNFVFTEQEGREKWTAYKFTKNVYDVWMPLLLEKICSAIDDLPSDISFGISGAASFSQNSQQSLMLDEEDSQPSAMGSQEVTPTTSFTQANERASKKPRNQLAGGRQC
ncbi:hypothetical protein MMC30_000848 [Trapelia coarctata]|nr:hypothetical protein [Trapelia coarctata]